ncbi:hypothetical protein ACO0KY_18570 [Undibacterium sp. Dicai25W]|uniref:hypothetical protein n=1 Tax=Undibacterium sp. Dicai25W TaxID=3413034 RepID=UPI003BF1007F
MKFWKDLLNGASIFVGLFAAFLWWKASIVTLPIEDRLDSNGWADAQISIKSETGEHIDPFRTATEQSKWNKWAAQASALAAFFQAIVWMMPG